MEKYLNERCLQGPDLVNKLLFVLLRSHMHRYSVQADIGAIYSQASIPPHDHDALRFLGIKMVSCYTCTCLHIYLVELGELVPARMH